MGTPRYAWPTRLGARLTIWAGIHSDKRRTGLQSNLRRGRGYAVAQPATGRDRLGSTDAARAINMSGSSKAEPQAEAELPFIEGLPREVLSGRDHGEAAEVANRAVGIQ